MVAPLITQPKRAANLAELLSPDLRVNGAEPELRILASDISWERYLKIDREFGEDRSTPRLYYHAGKLEIMSTSEEHERIKKWLAGFLEIYFEENGIEIITRGQATIRLKKSGAEPDESWCIGSAKKMPDLVLEIALSTGGLNKLEIYRPFKIPEVWIWRARKLEIFSFKRHDYARVPASVLLPDLDIRLLERCISMSSWQQARKTFRASLKG